jgi:hypothetical protein
MQSVDVREERYKMRKALSGKVELERGKDERL